jgi:riboflavin kinase/FMN adenylyltransferase
MLIHEGYENLDLIGPVVTLGIFDGVHLGHRALIDRVVSAAKEAHTESVVITFFPHPRLVLDQKNENLLFLSTMEEKKMLLGKSGVDHLIIIEFTHQFSKIQACDFINDVLIEKVRAKHLIIGYNHHLGRKGEGDFNTIKKCAETLDFTVEQVGGFHTGEVMISSSLIREALLKGRIEEANSWLGYSYALTGTIIEGRKIGRSIGFPTANIDIPDRHKLIPANGIYAVEVIFEEKRYAGMMSIGSNPTVNRDTGYRSIEVHILDFDMDIYGKSLSVVFRKKLRDEIKFENTDQLADQMKLDKQQVLMLFA